MMSYTYSRSLCLILILVLLLPLAGCSSWWLVGDAIAAFAAGWFANDQFGSVQQTLCFQNGQPVDCSTLPDGFVP